MKKVSLLSGIAVIVVAVSCNNQPSDSNQSKEMKHDEMQMKDMKMDSMKMDTTMRVNQQPMDSSKK